MIKFDPSDQVIIYQRFDHSDVWTLTVVGLGSFKNLR